jgi:sterol desaturase/sphingolipid hydroxylase (fatty acid hydroxylase superfamily)
MRSITVLVLALLALSVGTVTAVYFWPGWGSMPLDILPTLFWIIYITVAAGWFILDMANIFRPTDVSKSGRTPMFDVIMLVSGVIFVGGSLFGSVWTGGRLFQLTVGGLLAVQGGSALIGAYLAKGGKLRRPRRL